MGKFRLLKANEIEIKVKQVTEKGAIALIYKTSRVDMDILDETVGCDNWADDYREIKGNLYCGIGIREHVDAPFVWKWDCGIESRSDDEGNEKKGEASDAFKRSAVKWGIGRELYSAPFIFIPAETVQDGKRWKLKNPFTSYSVSHIAYDENDKIKELTIVTDKGETVFSYPKKKAVAEQQPKQAPTKRETVQKRTETQEQGKRFNPLTRAEMMQFYGVKNVEQTIEWFEDRFQVAFDEWGQEECEMARMKLAEKKRKREAEERAKNATYSDEDMPFPMGEQE